jgi:hypothetical protein
MTARNEKGKFTKNPDEEVATKGYVKCLIRKTRDHTHANSATGACTCAIMISGVILMAVVCLWSCIVEHSIISVEAWVTLFAATGICTAVTVDIMYMNSESTQGVDGVEPYYIRKHTDKKKDCEE